ncbi:MAG: pseudouridine synthase [Bacteroidota bacterium]
MTAHIKLLLNKEYIYIAYNKPVGVVCTTEKVEGNIIDAIKHPDGLLPIGRLDKDSEGLILLTNDKSIINKIIHPDFEHEKEYIVTLNMPLRNQFIKQMAEGIDIGTEITKPCNIKAEPNSRRIFRIVLKQGLNRQIRRMCNAFGYQVLKLQRIRIMHIQIGKLKPGEWRYLTGEELEEMLRLLK